jgi:cysteinyl-tRNA synthetase
MKIYNTLTRQLEELVVKDNTVNMYVCGITPYSSSHLGHAMCAIVFDVIRRYLEYKGFDVNHIQNFTDVDDKMIKASNEQGIEVFELAELNIKSYLNELQLLNVLPATEYPRATEEISEIIKIVTLLVANGDAYVKDGDVYFRVKNSSDYGKLSNRNIRDLEPGARLDLDESKESPEDFALWKAAKLGEPSWESPWGMGRPGWHIECTAMAIRYLGETIDIHGGGVDLVFPHHENEIAQSEAFTRVKPFAKVWIHNGTLQYGLDKMSKSVGNIFSVEQALQTYSADSLRMFFLTSHYRSPLVFDEEVIKSQDKAISRLRSAYQAISGDSEPLFVDGYKQDFINAMDEDFNTPKALAVIFDLARDINREASNGRNVESAQKLLNELSEVLGIKIEKNNTEFQLDVAPFIELLLEVRNDLRKSKQFEIADSIRDRLEEMNVTIEDSKQNTSWDIS